MTNISFDERKILRACLEGDTSSFEMLVEKYQSLVCAITYSAAGRIDESEELAQQVFINAWKNLYQLNDHSKFKAWLVSITKNIIKDSLKKNNRSIESKSASINDLKQIPGKGAGPVDNLISKEQQSVVDNALRSLPEIYREPIVLFYRQGDSVKEVAEVLQLTEDTVRTRLYRARKLLKERMDLMVEQTLEKTAPGKIFTAIVMASVASVALKTTAAGAAVSTNVTAAAAAGTGAAEVSSAGAAATGMFTAATVKIAAALIVAATVTVSGIAVYNNNRHKQHDAQTAAQSQIQENSEESAIQITEQKYEAAEQLPGYQSQNTVENSLQNDEIYEPVIYETKGQTDASSRHPDWPPPGEELKDIHLKKGKGDMVEDELWIRLPNKYRYKQGTLTVIDNGKQRIRINSDEKTVQYAETWTSGQEPVFENGQPLEKLNYINYAYLFGRDERKASDSGLIEEISFEKIGAEDDGRLEIYKMLPFEDNAAYDVMAYVDAATLLPERMYSVNTDTNSETNGEIMEDYYFDYSPIDDSMFEYSAGADETVLPFTKEPCFSGKVVDLNGDPVADADVFIFYFPLYEKEYLTCRTNEEGKFEIGIQKMAGRDTVNLPVYYWATVPYDPNFAAWTILCSENYFNDGDFRYHILGYGGDITQTDSRPKIEIKNENGQIVEYETLDTFQRRPVVENIELVMEPAGIIDGYVTDEEGNAIAAARLSAGFKACDDKGNSTGFASRGINWRFDSVSDENGYYQCMGIPPLWKRCRFEIDVEAEGFVSEMKWFRSEKPVDYKQFDIVLTPQAVTIRGCLKDNYGEPLKGRNLNLSVENMAVRDCSTVTEPNGFFMLKGCPDIEGMKIASWLSSVYPENNFLTPQNQLDEFLYYPNVTEYIPYRQGQKEYFVEMTAIRPETFVQVRVTDSTGNELPEYKVMLDGCLADEKFDKRPIPYPWQQLKLEKRTGQNGIAVFDNVPDLSEMSIIVAADLDFTREIHMLSGNQKELLRLNAIDNEYRNLYEQIRIPVGIVKGQNEYYVEVVMEGKQ